METFTVDYINWRFFETPYDKNINWGAYDGQILIGHAALSARLLTVGNRNIWAGQSLGSAVDPRYQKKGIYTSLAKLLYGKALENGIRFIWGFPNHNSHYGRIAKLGWQDIYEIPMKRLWIKDIQKQAKPSLEVRETDITDFDFEKFSKSVNDDRYLKFVRDSVYFEWRYGKNPRYHYIAYTAERLGRNNTGCMVIKYFNGSRGSWIDIVDYVAASSEVFESMVDRVILKGLKTNGVTGVNVWANTHHLFAPLLEKRGFVNSAPITFFSFYKGNWETDEKDLIRLSDFRNWYLTLGDSDVY